MSYSDIVGSISGLLQFAVACYALRVSRRYGLARVGWLFFGAYTLLAAVHVLLSVHPFGIQLEPGVSVNVLYEIISILLLGTIAQTEYMIWKHNQQVNAEQQARAREEAKVAEQVAQLNRSNEELKQIATRVQAEAAQHQQAQEQAHAELMKAFEDQLNAARLSEAALQESVARLEAEVARQMQIQLQQQTQAQEQVDAQAQAQAQQHAQALEQLEKAYQEQLAALHQSEQEWRTTAAMLQGESAQQKQALEQIEKSYQDQLAALHHSEGLWRAVAARLQAEVAPPKPAPDPEPPVNHTCVDPLAVLRQSGIAEVATMTQTRVAYLARLAKLMRDHTRDLGKFMTRNPQGRKLPDSLSLLIDYLSDEQFLLVKRIEFVKKTFEQTKPAGASQPPHSQVSAAAASGTADPFPAGLPPVPAGEPGQPVAAPAEGNPPGEFAGDFLEHLITNVTETGTELAPKAPEVEVPERAGDLFDTNATRT